MTNINQNRDSIGSGIRFQFASAGDTYHVFSPVKVTSTDNYAISGIANGVGLFIEGAVSSSGGVVSLSGSENEVYIGASGTVNAIAPSSSVMVQLQGGDSQVINEGRILGQSTSFGVGLRGGGNEMINTGMVSAITGVVLGLTGGPGGDSLVNKGTISGNDVGVSNSRYGNGVLVEAQDTFILNAVGGKISAISSEGAGVSVSYLTGTGGDGSMIENHGTITSKQWYGVDFANMVDTETAGLQNYGTIGGDSGSFRGNASGETIINSGKMLGNIDLGAGDDIFHGEKGSVKGAIIGGDGNDYISGGNGNQSISGGLNDDILAGGKGNDTLSGGAGPDIFIFSTGFQRDTVTDFTNFSDHIDLSHLKEIKDFADLEKNHLQKHGDDMWIVAKGGDVLILKNVAPGALDVSDFIL